ncbi:MULTISPECIES: GNAT family N-acetyltransferase [unclassified Methanosarcina]|uniref:GNAT family N-acetyltransferase n=1 Tax=unclassified Methanosarcina TaxID=2644672 RepID=UPI00064F9362|nr:MULTISPECIES: GNAT family N-acetyltransferase [unclassified Methanosarcina]
MEKKHEPLFRIEWINAKNSEALEDAFDVRREVFIKEQNIPEDEEFDEADLRSHHVIVYANSRPVATGRLLKEREMWLIGRISVLKECRGKHVGKLVVDKLLEQAIELGAAEVNIHAQTHAVSFYEKFGFVAFGDTFLEAGIEHISMIKKI